MKQSMCCSAPMKNPQCGDCDGEGGSHESGECKNCDGWGQHIDEWECTKCGERYAD